MRCRSNKRTTTSRGFLAGLAASVWWFCGGRRLADRPERIVRAIMLVLAYAVQFWLLRDQRMGMAINWSLFWHYLATAAFFYLATRHPGIGVRFTALSFLAWALVFPVAVGMSILWPQIAALAVMGAATLGLASRRFPKTLA